MCNFSFLPIVSIKKTQEHKIQRKTQSVTPVIKTQCFQINYILIDIGFTFLNFVSIFFQKPTRTQHLQNVFDFFRFVDLEELQAWSLKAFDSFETDDVKEEFSSIDTNKDRLVSWKEHAEDMFGQDFSLKDADKKNQQQFNKEQKLYSASDLNNDTQLSMDEYLIFRIPRSHQETKKVIIRNALDNYDTNSDGVISLDEFLKETDHDANDHDFIESETERFKDEFDENDDGVLNDDEILKWVDPDNREDAHDEADHLMSECDTNSDQKLSADEILSNHHLWVESDATDYGRHLLLDHDEF